MERLFVGIASIGLCAIANALMPAAQGYDCPGTYGMGLPKCRNIANDVAAIGAFAAAVGAVGGLMIVFRDDDK